MVVLKMSTYDLNLRTVDDAPLADALFGKARRRILGLLLTHADEAFYPRQIERLLGMSVGALHRELRNLVEAGILVRMPQGREVYYRANRGSPVFEDLHNLLIKTVGLGDVLRASLARLAEQIEVAFVYGSVAKGTSTAASDVDVMVIGSVTFADVVSALNPVQDTLRREVNPSVYSPEEVRKRLDSGHHFLTTVLDEPKLYLIGDAHDLERLAEGRAAD
ncbi:MAG: helix-turn-helix domain-containing protein [Anaerolineae bacterium]